MHINYPSITKFQQLVELKDYRKPTKKEYVRYVRKLAEHFQCDPATLTEDQLRQYFLFLREHKHYSRSPMKMAKYALLCFFVECLKISGWTVFREVRIAEPQVLPVVLSRAEVRSVLAAVREPRFRACLGLMYHCGLRVGEAIRVRVKDICGREQPPRLLVSSGKGGKQRYVPLTPAMVEELRAWWRIHQNPTFLFPTPGRGWADRTLTLSQAMHQNTGPMSESCVQSAYRLARAASGVNPGSTTHTLRHSYPMLLRESAAALREVARDHKDLGAQIGFLALLQTWTRDLRYHPHIHCVVPAGGLSPDGLRWVSPKRANYFLPQAVLAQRFRSRLKAALQHNHPALFAQIPHSTWSLNWVADVQPVGTGEPALKYLAAYVYRTALSAQRIVSDDGLTIAFTCKDSKDRQTRTVRLTPEQFLHRFLQHVLPRGFQRIRYFGFLSAAAKNQWQRVLALWDWTPPALIASPPLAPPICPACHKPMTRIGQLARAPPLRWP